MNASKECRSKLTLMYPNSPYQYYKLTCEHKGCDYGIDWEPPYCPMCGKRLVITEREVWRG